ncbi:MAG: NAD-dependent epimerase/dehydratase family protein [Acidobacteriia bacterium]|nr:NAD-dependent epimerase/dehydratase family protein [Terriglobia bacterium]
MAKILVTGGAGFVGSHIVDAFLAAGHEVVVVDDLFTGRRENVNPDCEFHEMDIRDPRLEALFQYHKFELVSHQAALGNVRASMEDPMRYADVNVRGGVNVLECCRKYDVRKIVYSSTGGCVYGEPRYLPADEAHPLQPRDPYGASKASYELYLPVYQMNYELSYTILRYPNVYGPRQDPFGEAGVVSIFIGQMLRNLQPIINGDGEQLRDYVHVSDVVCANLMVVNKGDNGVFNVGWGKGTSVNQVFHSLRAILGSSAREVHGPPKLGEIRQTYLNSAKAAEVLGWRPTVSLQAGLQSTAEYFRCTLAKQIAPQVA